MDKGIYEPLLVFLVLFVRAALELGQHKNELVTVIDRRGGGFINGGQLGTQYAFLFFEITQPGREPGAAGSVLNGAHDVILLSDIFGQFRFQHFFFGIFPALVGKLDGNHPVGDLFQLTGGKDIISGSGGNQVFKIALFDIVFFTLMDGVL